MSREGALWVGGLEAYMDEPFLQHCLLCMGEAAPVSIKVCLFSGWFTLIWYRVRIPLNHVITTGDEEQIFWSCSWLWVHQLFKWPGKPISIDRRTIYLFFLLKKERNNPYQCPSQSLKNPWNPKDICCEDKVNKLYLYLKMGVLFISQHIKLLFLYIRNNIIMNIFNVLWQQVPTSCRS